MILLDFEINISVITKRSYFWDIANFSKKIIFHPRIIAFFMWNKNQGDYNFELLICIIW